MGAIIYRLSKLEQEIDDIQRRKSRIPVLFVREDPKDVYAYSDTVLNGLEELQKYAEEHGAETIIIDNIPRPSR